LDSLNLRWGWTPASNRESEQNFRWKEHFEEVLNQPELLSTPDSGTLLWRTPLRSTGETSTLKKSNVQSLSSLMNNRAPGVDEISAEMLKHGKKTVAEQLAELFNMIWQDLEVPEDWKKGVIIKLPKRNSQGLQ